MRAGFKILKSSEASAQILWTLFFFIVFGVQQVNRWPLVKSSGWGGGSSFVDLRSVLHASECSEEIGWDIYDPSKNCGYIYGSLLIRVLRWTNLGPEFTLELGWIFILLFSIVSGYVFSTLKNLSKIQKFVCVVIFVSPGSMLLLERGNFDILLILLLFVSALCLQKKWFGLGFAAIALCALFKFYTLPILFALSLYLRTLKATIFSLLVSSIVAILVVRDLVGIKEEFPDNVLASFGNQIFAGYLNYVGLDIPRFLREIIGLLAILGCTILVWLTNRSSIIKVAQHLQSRRFYSLSDYIIALFSFSYLICYFAGLNYDYRLPYLTISTLLLLSVMISNRINCWPLILCLLVICWTSFNVGVLQILGDFFVLILTSYWIVFYTIYLKSSQSLFGFMTTYHR
jgi:hypothetical protein